MATSSTSAASSSQDPDPRIQGVAICRPIVTGSIAFWLGRKAHEHHTHKWNIYVRGLECEDLSYFIRKVVFQLHPTLPHPVRVVEEPPFEVSETGWGEFEVAIRVYFKDPSERPVDVIQPLKLYPPGNYQQPVSGKPVVHENYDEIIFHEPRESFHKALMAGPPADTPRHPLTDFFTAFSETQDLAKIAAAQRFVDKELETLRDEMLQQDMKKEVAAEQAAAATAAAASAAAASAAASASAASASAAEGDGEAEAAPDDAPASKKSRIGDDGDAATAAAGGSG